MNEKLEEKKGAFITIEAVDENLGRKLGTILETALRYEFKDSKFLVVFPSSCSDLARVCNHYIESNSTIGSTDLLLNYTILSEANNIIKENINNGVNIICISYIANTLYNLINKYNPINAASILQNADLVINSNADIIVFSEVSEELSNKLQYFYNIYSSEEDNKKCYRVDYNGGDIMVSVDDIIADIRTALDNLDKDKEISEEIHKEEDSE